LVFAPASLILTNYFLPLSEALCNLKIMMQPENPVTELRQLIKDARWAILSLVFINVVVLLFFFIDGVFNQFVFVALFIQAFLFVVWLFPVFCYQVFYKKLSVKYAFYKALATYKEALGHVSW
jgi:hypothetical protein